MTKIINIKSGQPFDVYIGRFHRDQKLGFFPASNWRNKYKEGIDGTREEILEKYRQDILSKPELLKQLPELKGKTLGCWCKPESCHGDVLIELLEKMKLRKLR